VSPTPPSSASGAKVIRKPPPFHPSQSQWGDRPSSSAWGQPVCHRSVLTSHGGSSAAFPPPRPSKKIDDQPCLPLCPPGLDETSSSLEPQVHVGAETAKSPAVDLTDCVVLLPPEPSAAAAVTLTAPAPWQELEVLNPAERIAAWTTPRHPTAPMPDELGCAYPHPPSWYNSPTSGCTSGSRTQLGATCGHLGCRSLPLSLCRRASPHCVGMACLPPPLHRMTQQRETQDGRVSEWAGAGAGEGVQCLFARRLFSDI
jgi:hypothetical protein